MSTTYYLLKEKDCLCSENSGIRYRIYEEEKLGRSSCGWRFVFNKDFIENHDEILERETLEYHLKQCIIINEYEETLTTKDMIEIIYSENLHKQKYDENDEIVLDYFNCYYL